MNTESAKAPAHRRAAPGRRLSIGLSAAVAGALVLGLAATGSGYPAARPKLLSGAAWLASTQVGQLTLLDGASAEVAAQVQVAPAGPGLDVVQQGSTAYAVNGPSGSIRRVDGATFQVSPPATPIVGAGGHLTAFATANTLYALDTGRGVLTMADPTTLANRAGPVPLATRTTAQAASVDAAGRLWLLDAATGDLVWVDGGRRRVRAGAATPGAGLLTFADGAPVIVDTRRHTAELLDPGSGEPRQTTQLDLRPDDRIAVGGSAHSPRLYLVASRGELTICELTGTPCSEAVPLAAGGGDPGPPVEVNDRLFVPDYASGRVWVIDLRRLAVLATPQVVSPTTRFQLLAHDGVVFFNDPDSANAGVIRLDGGVRAVAKYDPKNPGKGTTGGLGQPGETQPGPGSQPDPPATGPSSPPPDIPPGGPAVTISVNRRAPMVGEDVTLSVGTRGTPAPVAARWTFGDGQGGSGLTTTHRWTSAQRFQVTVQATFPDGRTGATSISIQVVDQPVGTVVVKINNTGGGTVTSQPAGIACPPTCSTGFPVGTPLTLTAAAARNFTFNGWAGACSGPSCALTVAAGQTNVTANFTAAVPTTARLTVRFTGTGGGRVSGQNQASSPVNCTANCSVDLPIGTRLNLLETPSSAHSLFHGWGRDCGDTGDDMCLITLSADTTVTVNYEKVFLLTIDTIVTGPGDPATCCGIGIPGGTCFVSCRDQPLSPNTVYTMTATPQNAVFTGWSGDCTGTQTTCRVTMTTDRTVHANFTTS